MISTTTRNMRIAVPLSTDDSRALSSIRDEPWPSMLAPKDVTPPTGIVDCPQAVSIRLQRRREAGRVHNSATRLRPCYGLQLRPGGEAANSYLELKLRESAMLAGVTTKREMSRLSWQGAASFGEGG